MREGGGFNLLVSILPTPYLQTMWTTALVTAAAIVVMATPWLLYAYHRLSNPPRKAVVKAPESPLEARVAGLEVRVASLPSLWEEERRRAEKAAERERAHAAKAAKDLAQLRMELDEEDEEVEPLSGSDAGGSRAGGLHPMSSGMANGESADPEHIARAKAVGYPWSFLN